MQTEMELVLEQTQQGSSHEVSVSTEGVEELKRISSRLLRYAKSRPNEKLIYNSIINGPYVRQMIPEPGDAACSDIGIQEKKAKLFNEWERFTSTDRESFESYYHRFSKLMNDFKRNKHFPEKIASNLKFLNNLQPEWSRHVTIVHQTKDLHTADYTQLYDFLKYNQKEMVRGNGGNQFREFARQNVGNQIQEVNANCILMANFQQASTSGTQSDKAPVYDSDGSAEVQLYDNCYDDEIFNIFTQEEQYTDLLKPIPEPHQVQQNDSNVTSAVSSIEQGGRNSIEETRVLYDSLYNNLATEFEKVISVNRKLRETNANLTTELARYKNREKCFEISQEKYDKLERINPFKNSREAKYVPNKPANESARTNPITGPQPHVITKKVVNSNSHGFSSTRVDITTKNRRPQPRSNTKNDMVPSASKSSRIKNKEVKVEDHPRNLLLSKVYFVEGLGHNLFSVGQFCDSDLEVVFRRNICFVKNLEGVVLLKGNRTTNLYTINIHDMASASPICLMARATSTKSWLWHQRLSLLNFDTIHDLAKNDLVTGLLKFKYQKEHLFSLVSKEKAKGHLTHPNLKLDISFLYVFEALYYPKNDHEDVGKLGAKGGDIVFFIGYSANSCAYRVYNQRTKKIVKAMNVTFNELSAMAYVHFSA
nr:integrase, catalytic region, zinc finger, CCHC-type, peptidase aspartic, catalytic [Tanacetum cinerariifolium]